MNQSRGRRLSDSPVLKRRTIVRDPDENQSLSRTQKELHEIGNELEFARWYNDVEDSLLESSYEEYQYAPFSRDV